MSLYLYLWIFVYFLEIFFPAEANLASLWSIEPFFQNWHCYTFVAFAKKTINVFIRSFFTTHQWYRKQGTIVHKSLHFPQNILVHCMLWVLSFWWFGQRTFFRAERFIFLRLVRKMTKSIAFFSHKSILFNHSILWLSNFVFILFYSKSHRCAK